MLMEIDVRRERKGSRKKHMMHEDLYSGQGRIAYKGQPFSAPMDWRSMIEQIEASDLFASSREKRQLLESELRVMQEAEKLISVPVTGAILAQRVRVVIEAGLVDLEKILNPSWHPVCTHHLLCNNRSNIHL